MYFHWLKVLGLKNQSDTPHWAILPARTLIHTNKYYWGATISKTLCLALPLVSAGEKFLKTVTKTYTATKAR